MPIILMSALFLGACQLAGPLTPSGAKRVGSAATGASAGTNTPMAKKPASPESTRPDALAAVGNGALSQANKDSLVRSIHHALAATRASRMSATLNEASGIIANNGGGVLSDNGLGLIANNGGGVLSDNGLGYRVAAAAEVDYTSETPDLVYHFRFKPYSAPAPRNGTMKIYEKTGFQSSVPGDRDKALLDHFVWDDIGLQLGHGGVPLHVAITFPMSKVSSKRLNFADKMTTRRIVKLESLTGTAMTDVGWEYEFDLRIALLGGEKDTASFKAVAGEQDLSSVGTSRGSNQTLPARLTVTGQNEGGTYAGTADSLKHRAEITHTATDGLQTRVGFYSPPGGTSHLEVESLTTGFTVTTDLHGEGGGEGELLAKGEQVGTMRYDAEGVATITFKDGSTVQARLF